MKNTVIVSHDNWSTSHEGRNISLTYFGAQSLDSIAQPLLLIGGVHGDEPEGVYLAESTLRWLKSLSIVELSKSKPWIIIPCLNPDGYAQNQRTNGRGVDINRNFPAKNWSENYSQNRYYPGPSANSEIENQSLSGLIYSIKPYLIIHCHSWKPCIVRSGPKTLKEAQFLSDSSGYDIVDDIGYATPGSLSSFAWKDLQIPVICIEDSEHRDQRLVWPRFSSGMQKCFFK